MEESTNGASLLFAYLLSWGWYLLLPLQILSILHVVKTGRSAFWIWIILIAGPVGIPLYLILEVLPDIRRGEFSLGQFQRFRKPTAKQLRALRREIELSNSVKNRTNLADALLATGQYAEALAIYENCLGGVYQDDPALLWGVAQCAVELADWAKAESALAKLDAKKWADYRPQRTLLRARTAEGLGKLDQARSLFAAAAATHSGEEARCRQASLLLKLGEKEAARDIFAQIIQDTRRQGGSYKIRNKKWYELAKKWMPKSGG